MDHLENLQQQRLYFQEGHLRSYQARKQQLMQLNMLVKAHEKEIAQALFDDLGKSHVEAYTSEIGFILQELKHTLRHLKSWMAPVKVPTPLPLLPARSAMLAEGRGVNLIISPWNYPFQLLMAPLVGCLAAGNTAVLMPSDQASATAALIEALILKYFDPRVVTVINGSGADTFEKLTKSFRFDYIFFTGSTSVGKVVAIRAAEQLIPFTLELGGKSPAIVQSEAKLSIAARRIVWGKFYNCGQTCVCPDYVLVAQHLEEKLLKKMKEEVVNFYSAKPEQSPDYGKIINKRRLQKLATYLADGEILHGGRILEDECFMEPTLLRPHSMDTAVMKDEIFGPILPVINYRTEQEMLEIIAANPNPLALYVFSDPDYAKELMEKIPFGGGVINHTIIHLANPELAFGGIANSGIGKYHGKFSFDCFSHMKSVMNYPSWLDIKLFYPPYKGKLKWVRKLI